MKKIILFSLAAAGIVSYLLNRKKTAVKTEPELHTHHLTQAFSKAKQHAINS
ncbi:hypothetical protein [Segetibacter koreensis]|uniref:hypothetical protein n=1 Tax=Segetibacter koreensis TaxID=398037 RepID=UPI000371A48A|nr:hypothetical protein [Segetibacter koreensis]